MISPVDSYYSYIQKRLQDLNAVVSINGVDTAQPVCGLVDAQDWPQTRVQDCGLYLLVQRVVPGGKSKTQRQYTYYVQWSWIIIGTDLSSQNQGENRGDRYRVNMQIMDNLKEANFGGFCQKIDYSADSQGMVSGAAVGRNEQVVWNELAFMPRVDSKGSGVLYNAAKTELSAWEEVAAAAALTLSDTQGAQIVA